MQSTVSRPGYRTGTYIQAGQRCNLQVSYLSKSSIEHPWSKPYKNISNSYNVWHSPLAGYFFNFLNRSQILVNKKLKRCELQHFNQNGQTSVDTAAVTSNSWYFWSRYLAVSHPLTGAIRKWVSKLCFTKRYILTSSCFVKTETSIFKMHDFIVPVTAADLIKSYLRARLKSLLYWSETIYSPAYRFLSPPTLVRDKTSAPSFYRKLANSICHPSALGVCVNFSLDVFST